MVELGRVEVRFEQGDGVMVGRPVFWQHPPHAGDNHAGHLELIDDLQGLAQLILGQMAQYRSRGYPYWTQS